MRPRLGILAPLLVLFAAGVLSACSGPSGASDGSEAGSAGARSSVPPFRSGSFVLVNDRAAVRVNLASGERRTIGPGARLAFASLSRFGAHAVAAFADSSASRLVLLSRSSGDTLTLHTGSPDLVYSAAWSPDSTQLAFGYYEPAVRNDRPAMGAGDILIARLEDGSVSRLGCSASREVLLWSSAEQLVVRGADELYRVARADCGTIQTVDIRLWHHITPAPIGSRIAYILRELSFNRETRNYEPDSALFVQSTAGAGGTKVAGDRYRPRNLAWSPDAEELAFDVLVSPDSARRAVAVFSVADAQTAYVSPPLESALSRSHPSWDPTGTQLSYLVEGERLVLRSNDMRFPREISVGGRPATGLIGWLSPTTLLVEAGSDEVWFYDLAFGRSERAGTGDAFIF